MASSVSRNSEASPLGGLRQVFRGGFVSRPSKNPLRKAAGGLPLLGAAHDEAFAKRLVEALKAHGVETFFFPDDAVPGEKLHREMWKVNTYDRVILIASERSLNRPGVLNEIEQTITREARDGGASYLIPITLDDFVFSGWNPTRADLAQSIRDRVVADFRGAEGDPAKFAEDIKRLLVALRPALSSSHDTQSQQNDIGNAPRAGTEGKSGFRISKQRLIGASTLALATACLVAISTVIFYARRIADNANSDAGNADHDAGNADHDAGLPMCSASDIRLVVVGGSGPGPKVVIDTVRPCTVELKKLDVTYERTDKSEKLTVSVEVPNGALAPGRTTIPVPLPHNVPGNREFKVQAKADFRVPHGESFALEATGEKYRVRPGIHWLEGVRGMAHCDDNGCWSHYCKPPYGIGLEDLADFGRGSTVCLLRAREWASRPINVLPCGA